MEAEEYVNINVNGNKSFNIVIGVAVSYSSLAFRIQSGSGTFNLFLMWK